MSRVMSGDKLIESVRLKGMVPEDSATYNDSDILTIANEELDMKIIETLLSLHEEHLTVHIDIPRNTTGIYDIPYRAVGNKIRDIQLINGQDVWEMSQIGLGSLPDYTFDTTAGYDNDKFYVESNQIKLIRPSRSYDKVRIYFYLRPNVITKLEEAGKITNVTEVDDTVVLTLNSIPNKFTNALDYDIVGSRTPNKIKQYDLTPVSVSATTATVVFNSSDIDNISELIVGDYLCQAEESPFPNIPTEMHPYLAQMATIHILEGTGDTEALGNAQRRLAEMEKNIQSLVDDRVELAPKKIRPRHGTLYEATNILGSRRRRRSY